MSAFIENSSHFVFQARVKGGYVVPMLRVIVSDNNNQEDNGTCTATNATLEPIDQLHVSPNNNVAEFGQSPNSSFYSSAQMSNGIYDTSPASRYIFAIRHSFVAPFFDRFQLSILFTAHIILN